MTCPHCPHCAQLEAIERERIGAAAAAMVPAQPPGPVPVRLSAAEAVRQFGVVAGLKLLQDEYTGRSGVLTEAQKAAERSGDMPLPLPPPAPAHRSSPRWLCVTCRDPLPSPPDAYCPRCADDSWARPPS